MEACAPHFFNSSVCFCLLGLDKTMAAVMSGCISLAIGSGTGVFIFSQVLNKNTRFY